MARFQVDGNHHRGSGELGAVPVFLVAILEGVATTVWGQPSCLQLPTALTEGIGLITAALILEQHSASGHRLGSFIFCCVGILFVTQRHDGIQRGSLVRGIEAKEDANH